MSPKISPLKSRQSKGAAGSAQPLGAKTKRLAALSLPGMNLDLSRGDVVAYQGSKYRVVDWRTKWDGTMILDLVLIEEGNDNADF